MFILDKKIYASASYHISYEISALYLRCPIGNLQQGKIECYDHSLKNEINLLNYYFPWKVEHEIGCFIYY